MKHNAREYGEKECLRCARCCYFRVKLVRFGLNEEVLARCVHLIGENTCEIYEKRPEVCRLYKCWEDDTLDRKIKWLK